ncbi:HIRAN domain-containing protein [Litoribacter populi]|uniref:HIRAN domain-containing protein n=1 Tax=Litoribacter populi TaxID=2598460 RepID=UPI00117E6B49|nr:HIRAN domain-containing protein [Litoribacter populi]
MKEIGLIYLTWREGQGKRRHRVGVLKRSATNGVLFKYLSEGVKQAQEDGFSPYTEFPDLEKEYKSGVLEIFGQRIMKQERSDIQDLFDFWEIDPKFKGDKYYMLAHTQGLNPTDNFEFLAEYNPVKELRFLTDLAGLSQFKLKPGILRPGDLLTYEKEPDNPYDRFAVKVLKGDTPIGYIKMVHSKVFHKSKRPLILQVKAVEENSTIKKVFLKVQA